MTKPCFTRTTIPDPNDARREIILFAIDDTIDPRRQRERANMGCVDRSLGSADIAQRRAWQRSSRARSTCRLGGQRGGIAVARGRL